MRAMTIVLYGLGLASSGVDSAPPPVMLDSAEVRAAIKGADPEKYERLAAVAMSAAETGCGKNLAGVLQTRHGVKSARCADFLMSQPPRTRLVFELDGTRYSISLTPAAHLGKRPDAD
jgi:hypothetical protein